jgi:hypothetical protein
VTPVPARILVGERARSPSLSSANEAKHGSTPPKPWPGCCPFPRHPSSPCGPHQDAGTSAARAKVRRSGSTWIIAHRMKAYRSMDERFTSGPSLGPRQRRGLAQCRAPPRGRTLRRPLLADGRVRGSPQSRTKTEPDGGNRSRPQTSSADSGYATSGKRGMRCRCAHHDKLYNRSRGAIGKPTPPAPAVGNRS